jgi:hypothetical protein
VRIAHGKGPEVLLYGSAATGTDWHASDIDLLVAGVCASNPDGSASLHAPDNLTPPLLLLLWCPSIGVIAPLANFQQRRVMRWGRSRHLGGVAAGKIALIGIATHLAMIEKPDVIDVIAGATCVGWYMVFMVCSRCFR